MSARWNENRKIARRMIVKGDLTLTTPARFGSGSDSIVTDMPILRDASSGAPLLPGSSIAGAMRAYLRERILGYEEAEPHDASSISQKLFGDVLEDVAEDQRQSRESYLTIDDAVAETSSIEFRPGVKINPATRIAAVEEDKAGQLYDMELLEAGTSFPLMLELDLPEDEGLQHDLLQGLAIALTGFEKSEIGLGARKRRGFGECRVTEWKVEDYNLKDPGQLVAWITGASGKEPSGKTVAEKMGFKESLPDERSLFKLEAEFRLASSLLIRSGSGRADAPEMVHLRSKRNNVDAPILSGTSLAGAMRARALRIANMVFSEDSLKAIKLVSDIFGSELTEKQTERKNEDDPFASRLLVHEREVNGRSDMVQTRIRIDRFTGGTFPGALFEQQPVIGGSQSKILVSIELRNPKDQQIGLLLHILKDLWIGDLPLGGESSAGRGRLAGLKADLYLHDPEQEKPEEWHLTPKGDGQIQIVGNREKLDTYAKSLGGAK